MPGCDGVSVDPRAAPRSTDLGVRANARHVWLTTPVLMVDRCAGRSGDGYPDTRAASRMTSRATLEEPEPQQLSSGIVRILEGDLQTGSSTAATRRSPPPPPAPRHRVRTDSAATSTVQPFAPPEVERHVRREANHVPVEFDVAPRPHGATVRSSRAHRRSRRRSHGRTGGGERGSTDPIEESSVGSVEGRRQHDEYRPIPASTNRIAC